MQLLCLHCVPRGRIACLCGVACMRRLHAVQRMFACHTSLATRLNRRSLTLPTCMRVQGAGGGCCRRQGAADMCSDHDDSRAR